MSFLMGFGIGAVVSVTPEIVLGTPFTLTSEMIARSHPNLLDSFVGLAAGLAAGFAIGRNKQVGTLAGVAIAAALVPPIATAGLEATMVANATIFHEQSLFAALSDNPYDVLTDANLIEQGEDVDGIWLVVGPLLLFVMNACAVIAGAFTGMRMVGMHRTTYPKRSNRWVAKAVLLLIFIIVVSVLCLTDAIGLRSL
jgi:uncharacterized membrane protein